MKTKKCRADKHVWNMGGECIYCGIFRGELPVLIDMDQEILREKYEEEHENKLL